MSIAVSVVLGLALIAAIIVVNGYFVAQEFAFMTVDRAQVEARAEQGDRAARRMLGITGRTSFLLSGAQLGITVTGLLVGYVAEPLVGNAVGELLAGAVPTATGIAIGTVGVLVVSTFAQMLFGELFPKNLAIARPYPLARWLSVSTLVYLRGLGWLIWVFDRSSAGLLRLLRIEPVQDVEHAANPRDLQRIVSVSREAGELTGELSLLLDRVLDFPERDVAHALVPRGQVDALREDALLGQVRTTMSHGHSHYPVLDHEGQIVGVCHLTDLLDAMATQEDPDAVPVTDVAREALVLSTLMSLPDALAAMVDAREQLACLVDEYGGFVGILTVEDLAEEVAGEITDEHDDEEQPHLVAASTGDRWRVRGDAPLDEVERELEHVLPRGDDYETVAGLVIAEHGGLPEQGTVVDIVLPGDPLERAQEDQPPGRVLRATVREVDQHVPATVVLELRNGETR